MLCPYCLEDTSKSHCTHCGVEIPELYKTTQTGILANKPITVSVIGFIGHGKSSFLSSLYETTDTLVPKTWQYFFRMGLDMSTVRNIADNRSLLASGLLPEATRVVLPKPNIDYFANMPRYGSKVILTYDPSGEAFESDATIAQYATHLQRTKAVILVISLTDLESPSSDLHRLLNIYKLGIAKLGINTKNQHLIITLTKGDKLQEQMSRYPDIAKHLQSGQDLTNLKNPSSYLSSLVSVSEQLKDYITHDLSAHSFVRLTDYFKSTDYCIVSALAQSPVEGRLSSPWKPLRSFDPMIWVLERTCAPRFDSWWKLFQQSTYHGKPGTRSYAPISESYIVRLYQEMLERLDLNELRVASFYLDIDFDSLSGENKAIKVLELIQYLKRRDDIERLLSYLEQERPTVRWRRL